MTGRQALPPGTDTMLIAEVVGLLNSAEHYLTAGADARLHYLDKRAALHRLVDATGYESSRYLAQDAEDRAADARAADEAMARECSAPPPKPGRV
ncbi:hypothetical protein [Streptomyces sp. V3I7]|uniref:hypothetical protein n=1 Tax=Streptomyces sp. V3I7 TaxID=3042278 RepID=UPI00277E2FC4|nr:hypothetical protein [Streptomyces sp. V3I7]MDQ0994785.1 hypothetical protein [Streptomyces sp. V3I7]